MNLRLLSLLLLLCVSPVSFAAAQTVTQTATPAPDPAAAATPDAATIDVDPHSLEIAQDLVKCFDMRSLMQSVLVTIMKSTTPLIDQENPGQGAKVEQIVGDTMQKTILVHVPELEKNKAIVYAQLFTAPELEQMKKFYQSPVGQKMLQQTPEMMRRNAALDQNIMQATVQDARKQLLDALKKNGMKIPKQLGV